MSVCVCVLGLRVRVSNGQQWLRVRERYNMVFAYVRRSKCYGSVCESESEWCSAVGRARECNRWSRVYTIPEPISRVSL